MKRFNNSASSFPLWGLMACSMAVGCMKNNDALLESDTAPVINFKLSQNSKNVSVTTEGGLEAKVKIGYMVPIGIEILDDNENLDKFGFVSEDNKAVFFVSEGEVIPLAEYKKTEFKNIIRDMGIQANMVGTHNLYIKAKDSFGKEQKLPITVTVAQNSNPVPALEIIQQDNLYLFDASKTYDPDLQFGDYIAKYVFMVDGADFVTTDDILYMGLGQGEHSVSVTAYDNDGGFASTDKKIINVE